MILKTMLNDGAPVPVHAKPGDAGLDLTSRKDVLVRPGETRMVTTGVCVEIPEGYFGMIAPRSGLSSKHGITFANNPGIIDSGYRGEITIALHNISKIPYMVRRGDRICQMIIIPYVHCDCIRVNKLDDTYRGDTGFGSSGTR